MLECNTAIRACYVWQMFFLDRNGLPDLTWLHQYHEKLQAVGWYLENYSTMEITRRRN